MLEVEEAQKRIWARLSPLGTEWVTLQHAHGRMLAQDVQALCDQPPAAMSAMDGYAVRASDALLDQPLKVVGTSAAGHPWNGAIGKGEALRVFTGSVLPEGTDAVLIQEDTRREGERVWPKAPIETGLYVRPRGLDFRTGWTGLHAGMRLDPRHIGLAASLGHAVLPVRRRPRVALIATGDELRWPGTTPGPGQIVSSNTPALAAMVQAFGGETMDLGIVADQPQPLAEALKSASAADIIVTTGGASVGDFDLVQETAGEIGMVLDFWKIRMRPGKPLIFGEIFGKPFLGLPGNPVSACVCAIVFLRGALLTMLGQPTALPVEQGLLGKPLGPNGPRQDYARGCFVDAGRTRIAAAPRQDSSMFATFAHADLLLIRPPHDDPRDIGEPIHFIDLAKLLGFFS